MSALADLRGFAPNRRAAPDFAPNLERLKSTRDAAGPLGLTLVPAEARGLDALEQAFATMIGERAQALTALAPAERGTSPGPTGSMSSSRPSLLTFMARRQLDLHV